MCREVEKWMIKMFELFTTIIGSHMWGMERPDSDFDYSTVYMIESENVLLGKNIRGKQKKDGIDDITYYELLPFIENLIKMNCNYLWGVMSPIIKYEYKNALRELREITSTNLAKNAFFSINGMAKHNIYHFITGLRNKEGADDTVNKRWTSKSREIDPNSVIYKKKLNVIGRSLKFGINLLTWEKCLFEKVNIKTEEELYDLKNKLNEAFKNSSLPEKPDKEPFEKYLIKWRLYKLKKDELI